MRDARITQIYEGANGVQALDLVGRKIPANIGRSLRTFFHPVDAFIQENVMDPEMKIYVMPLAKAFAKLQQGTAILGEKGMQNPDEAGCCIHRISSDVWFGGTRLYVGTHGENCKAETG